MSPGLVIIALSCALQAFTIYLIPQSCNLASIRKCLNQHISLNFPAQTILTYKREERMMYWTPTFLFSTSRQLSTHERPCFIQTPPTSPVARWYMHNNWLSQEKSLICSLFWISLTDFTLPTWWEWMETEKSCTGAHESWMFPPYRNNDGGNLKSLSYSNFSKIMRKPYILSTYHLYNNIINLILSIQNF